MNPTQTSTTIKLLSPTLHLYHYVLRNSLNERPETTDKRRQFFQENLHNLSTHLTSSTNKRASDFVQLIPIEQELAPSGNVLDFTTVPPECQKPNNDRLYLETGIIHSRLVARRLNDTYLLRFTSYVPSIHQEQALPIFANLGEHIANLPLELGQTVILGGILPSSYYSPSDIPQIAANCLIQYYGTQIDPNNLRVEEFLNSPFCIYAKPVTIQKFNNYAIESIHLSCVFLYQDPTIEQQADKVYRIFQDMLLSYHKIHFFHSQSIILKKILSQQYEAIERLTEDYNQQKWDSQSLKKLPQDSLDYYKKLSFLQDQSKTVGVNLKNYQECLRQIQQQTGQTPPQFFTDFEQEISFYREQMEANIGFLSPGIQLYEKLMLSVQTQVSIDEAAHQNQQNQQQAKLGQILAGVGAAIGVGQIIEAPITATVSHRLDQGKPEPSIASSWLGASLSVILSIGIGYCISLAVYRWFTQSKIS